MSSKKTTVIHWFRKGLRIHDNPALVKACDIVRSNSEKYVLRPIFILDEEIIKWIRVGANRFRFLQQSLEQLQANLKTINSNLYVIRGNPKNVFDRIFLEWNCDTLTYELDIEPYAKKRDEAVEIQAFVNGVKVFNFASHTIYNPELILQKNMGRPPMQYQKFMSIIENIKDPEPLEVPKKMSKETIPSKDSNEEENIDCYNIPKLEEVVKNLNELGPNKFPGGETEGLNRMAKYLKRTSYICKFEKPKTAPNSLEPSTTVLSPYLKFGCLSSRLFNKKLKETLKKDPKHSQPPVSLLGQLMWREYYYTAAASEPNFDKMLGNSICYQIPWQNNPEHLEAWAYGKTGYPFIDAIMRQLRQEGWIHHLARHAVACFLTRGDLWISWEEGQKVFEELLLDADWSLNAGNWMWLSCSAFFYQYFRVYSPVAFGKKTDPQGNYIKKYCPELKNYPAGIIYEPWKASIKAQQEYNCIIGEDYPERIVIHEIIHKENLKKMSEAYKINKELRSMGGLEHSGPSTASKRKLGEKPTQKNKIKKK